MADGVGRHKGAKRDDRSTAEEASGLSRGKQKSSIGSDRGCKEEEKTH